MLLDISELTETQQKVIESKLVPLIVAEIKDIIEEDEDGEIIKYAVPAFISHMIYWSNKDGYSELVFL